MAQKVPDRVLVCGKGNVMNDTNLIIDDQGGQFNLGIYNQLGIIQSVPRSPIPQNSNSSVTKYLTTVFPHIVSAHLCTATFGLMYGLYSRAAYDGTRTVYINDVKTLAS